MASCRPAAASQVSQNASPPMPQPLGIDHAERRVGGDGRIDGRTAGPQDREPGFGREMVRGDHRAAGAANQRDRRPRPFAGHAGGASPNVAAVPGPPT